MAAVTSLGVHSPVALPYLLAESLLPRDSSKQTYQWETYVTNVDGVDVEEEVIATKTAVVWSQGQFVRNIYRFDLDGEDVIQAVLTTFPSTSKPQIHAGNLSGTDRSARQHLHATTERKGQPAQHASQPAVDRALVVLTRSKAHIYFLHGATHIVSLPFEVERAFPAPRGLVLQRKATISAAIPPTPRLPNAPPNSFLTQNFRASQSYLQSPTLLKSWASTKPLQPSPLGGDSKLEALYQSLTTSSQREGDDDVANIYSLSNPLSELGVVTYSIQHHRPIRSGKQMDLNVEFEGLEPAEKVIYVSAQDEMADRGASSSGPLTLLATFNPDMSTVSVWHAWYTNEKSLRTLLKLRAEHKTAKARRRSSFLSASAATGTATPAVRRRDGPRDSFGNTLQPEGAGTHGNPTSRKPTKQEEEESMAARMDPDYRAAGSQQVAREGGRRVSSINADVRASQTAVGASFGGTAGRRHTSFGGQQAGRRSLSHRKSRGSTPGNVLSQSFGLDEDTMDLDSTIELDPEESLDGVLKHIRSTYDVSGIDTVFGSAEEGFKRELVVRKLHSFAVGLETSTGDGAVHAADRYRIATLTEPPSVNEPKDPRIRVYLHDRQSRQVQYAAVKVKYRKLYPDLPDSPVVAIPLCTGENRLDSCEGMIKLSDGKLHAILFAGRGVQFSLDEQLPCPLLVDAPYRAYNAFGLTPHTHDTRDVGRNRVLSPPLQPLHLRHRGAQGTFDVVDLSGTHHRRRIRLRPTDPLIDKLLTLCEAMLSKQEARTVRKTWCMAYAWLEQHPEQLESTACDGEFVAVIATMFTFIIGMLDSKARAAINLARVASGKATLRSSSTANISANSHHQRLAARAPWSWLCRAQLPPSSLSPRSQEKRKDQMLVTAAALADELCSSSVRDARQSETSTVSTAVRLMLALHVLREEFSLTTLAAMITPVRHLAPVITQLGSWLGLEEWRFAAGGFYSFAGASEENWATIKSRLLSPPRLSLLQQPVGVYEWFEHALEQRSADKFPSLFDIAQFGTDLVAPRVSENTVNTLTPLLTALSDVLFSTCGLSSNPVRTVELLAEKRFTTDVLETLPEAIAAPFMDAIVRCEREPPTTWNKTLLRLVGRADLTIDARRGSNSSPRSLATSSLGTRDVLAVCNAIEQSSVQAKTKEAGRHAISQLIFSEDRRMVEATSLMHFNTVQVGWCAKEQEWDEQKHFDMQRRVMHHVTTRMIALPAGDAMIHYDSQTPLLTERHHLAGFSSSCLMQPMGHTLTADRSGLTEEKVNWAYFHAGVSSGLRISKHVTGIDTSWIAFNKPSDLTNRHAGLLLALGLSGHLRKLAKWLSFKYLTPKHTMTSVGLLLGLSASYIGTMDALITKMLSVHITKMLPPGAADVNVSPATQTAGLLGVGLLYYNTQHRRMSEVMLSEIEYMEIEDPDSGPDPLRDESYRLAAGFALGLINLGKGNNLRGLHGMQLAERLLAMAVGPRPINAVHVFDRATAGAVMALAFVYMKSGHESVARKVNVPDTETQFDQVRPDVLMLRAMAKHIILWTSIEVRTDLKPGRVQEELTDKHNVGWSKVYTFERGWIGANLPKCYSNRTQTIHPGNRTHDSARIPFYNILAGLAWAFGLKYAGSGSHAARDELLSLAEWFNYMNWGAFTYDAKIARTAIERCVDVVMVAAAVVMAGTGDLEVYRFLRPMHARLEPQTPYGSHMAAHIAVGILFLAGGTFTFGTSDLAIAALMIAFHPIWPVEVNDNRVHLQAFRHLWVLAAEARCIIVEDVDTQRPIHMPIKVTLKNGEVKSIRAPCLLPELDSISTVQTDDASYWRVTLDFVGDTHHLESFRKDQRVRVRRCPAAEAHDSVFSAALAALTDLSLASKASVNNMAHSNGGQAPWLEFLSLPAFQGLDRADVDQLLPPEISSSVYTDDRTTVVDDRLVLANGVSSSIREELWNLRTLFAWAERAAAETREKGGESIKWLGNEVLQELKAGIEDRSRRA